MKYLVTFHTHSGSIKFRKHLRKFNIDIKLKPVPRKVSSNCGVAGELEYKDNIIDLLTDSVEGVYKVLDNTYENIYLND